MRFITIAALFSSLVVALPAVAPAADGTSLAIRGDNADLSGVVARNDLSERAIDKTAPWPATTSRGGDTTAQWEVTNLNNGKYQFKLWTSAPPNAGNLKFRISNGGVTLAEKILPPSAGRATFEVAKRGDNFNMWVDLA